MSTIDHAAEAYKLVDRAMYPPTDINRAQVHATLALVEQQRIANQLKVAELDQATYNAEARGDQTIRIRHYLSPEQWESIEYRQEESA